MAFLFNYTKRQTNSREKYNARVAQRFLHFHIRIVKSLAFNCRIIAESSASFRMSLRIDEQYHCKTVNFEIVSGETQNKHYN